MAAKRKKKRPAKAKPTARPALSSPKAKASTGRAGARSISKGNAQAKRPPARTVKPSGRRPTTIKRAAAKEPAKKRLPTKPRRVKPAPAKKPTRRSKRPRAGPTELTLARPPALSRHPDAVRARKYRREKKAIAEALEIERQEKLAARRERDRARRKKGETTPISDRELARGWLEAIRDHCARVAATTLEITTDDPQTRGTWIAVGRYDFLEDVSYADVGEMLERVLADDILSARINPNRLSQIRILFLDPDARERSGAGTFVSRIAAWEFAVGDMIGEILGGSASDEHSLAVRYDASKIPSLYIYFGASTQIWKTAGAFAKTATIS
jgi:hypothetical protein